MPHRRRHTACFHIALALLVLSAVTTSGQAQSTALERKVAGVTARAWSEEDLGRALAGSQRAREKYEHLFGAPAPALTTTLYADRSQAGTSGATAAGDATLSWPARTTNPPQISPWGEIGVLFVGHPRGMRVVGLYPTGVADGVDLAADEIVTKINDAPITNARDFARSVGAIPAGTTVALTVDGRNATRVLRFQKPARREVPLPPMLMAAALRAGSSEPTSVSTIAHEAMHHLSGARFGQLGLVPWFSEGVAGAVELDAERDAVRKRMKQASARWIPWQTLFTMPHPASGGVVVEGEGGAIGQNRTIMKSNDVQGQMFYDQSSTIIEFFRETFGAAMLGRLATSISEGRSMEDALRRIPETANIPMDQLERRWATWLMA